MRLKITGKLFGGLAVGLLWMAVPMDTTQAAGGRDVPYYNYNEANGSHWDGTHYYLSDGTMVTDAFFFDGNYTYYLMTDGTPMKDRLTYHPDGEHIIYFDLYGHEVFDHFAYVGYNIPSMETGLATALDEWCYFNTFGYQYTNVVTYDPSGTKLYYANPYGVLERNGWFQFSDTVMYPDTEGLRPWEGAAGGYGYAREDMTLMSNQYTHDWEGNLVYMEANGCMRPIDSMTTPILQRETDHFLFYCTDQDAQALDDLSETLENCYEKINSDLGKVPSGKTRIYLSPDLVTHHNVVGRPNAPDGSVGEARNGSVYMVSPLNPGPSHDYYGMLTVAVHEYVHIVVEQFGRRQPSYLNEGIACYEAGQLGNIKYYVPKDIANGTLPSLADLEATNDSTLLYTYGPAYIDFVAKTFGFDKVISLLEGKSQEEVFGMSREALNEKWMDFLLSYAN